VILGADTTLNTTKFSQFCFVRNSQQCCATARALTITQGPVAFTFTGIVGGGANGGIGDMLLNSTGLQHYCRISAASVTTNASAQRHHAQP